MKCNIYTVSRVSVSKHYAKQGSFSHAFWNLLTYDIWCSEFAIWGLLFTKSRRREGHWYSANHVSRDHWRHSQSSTEFMNSSRFTGSPVHGSQFAKYPYPFPHTRLESPFYTASCLTSTHNFTGVPLQRFFWWQWYFVVLLLITSIVIGFLSVSQIFSEMTYTVSSGTLNSTIPYHSVSKYNEVLLFPPP